jgi:serine-protein kinase ATM
MEQIFLLVNILLRENIETNKRNLNIRTYNVVSLSQQIGVIEWVENTMPIQTYLIGDRNSYKSSAHYRYRPYDHSHFDIRKKVESQFDRDDSNEEKLNFYLEIIEKFKPVFHHFFLENFTNPIDWYYQQLSYTRSVATSSMVGFILGLGDRHNQNILIDKSTSEVIHIDLGIAFDQGKLLGIPELVPFRLTRDIVNFF